MEQLVRVWAERCQRVAVYEHSAQQAQRTHVHMVLSGSEVCKKQLKNLLKIHNIDTQGTLGGNKDWSFKDWDGNENACSYMTKGYIKYSFLKSWTDEDHERWRSMWRGTARQSADQDRYDDCFNESLWEPAWYEYQRDPPTLRDATIEERRRFMFRDFYFVRQYVRDWVFHEYGRIWNVQAINQYKMLVYSHCYRNNIQIPPKDMVFREY